MAQSKDRAQKASDRNHQINLRRRHQNVVLDDGLGWRFVLRELRHVIDGDKEGHKDDQTADAVSEKDFGDVSVDNRDHWACNPSYVFSETPVKLPIRTGLDSFPQKSLTQSMALRVLLADESTTIKKVMQLALQDFAVEVKSVHSGVDVAEVARTFNPDIIFADVLLQKKNGYEVCAEIKRDPTLKAIPVVLMWSSFMDLDEKQAAASLADRRLEKPFDVENLRQLVMELVPKTRSQRLAHFLQYPESIVQPMREEIQKQTPPPAEPAAAAPTIAQPSAPATSGPEKAANDEEASSWNMESFEDISAFAGSELEIETDDEAESEAFSELRIVPPALSTEEAAPALEAESTPSELTTEDDRDPWSHQDLSRFKLDLEPADAGSPNNEMELAVDFAEPAPALSPTTPEPPPQQAPPAVGLDLNKSLKKGEIPALDADQLEQIVRAQSREVIEDLARRIVPDIATQIIRAELKRLLEEPGLE